MRVVRRHSSTSLFADMIAADFYSAVERLRAGQCLPTLGCLILELLCMLSTICTRRPLPTSSARLKGITVLICEKTIQSIVDSACPGLRPFTLIVACCLPGQVKCDDGTLSGACTTAGDRSTLTIFTFVGSLSMSLVAVTSYICNYVTREIHEYCPEDIHIFILLTGYWLAILSPRPVLPDQLDMLELVWAKMAVLAIFALRAGIPNCGCFFAGPHAHAVADLMRVVHDGPLELCEVPGCGYHWSPTVRARARDDEHGAGGIFGYELKLNRCSRLLLAHIRELAQAPSARDVVDVMFEILDGAMGTSCDVTAAYVNVWRWFCDPATSRLAGEKVVPFLKVRPFPQSLTAN